MSRPQRPRTPHRVQGARGARGKPCRAVRVEEAAATEFDLVIRGGMLVDGSGAPGHPGDVGVTDGRISAIGALAGAPAGMVIDASNRVVAPGFIDVHVHSEIALLGGPHRYGGLLQGVTTQLTAPDGFGWAPLPADRARALWDSTAFAYGPADLALDWSSPEAYLSFFRGHTPANVLPQVPHCAVRLAVMGWDPRAPSADELTAMGRVVARWLEAGACCLCLGLEYQPSAAAGTDELVAMCEVAHRYGAIYAAHIRMRESGLVAAWRETMELGRRSGIPVHISHSFVNDGTEPLLAEAAGVCDLTFESYMYAAGCTHMVLMLPQWAQAGGPDAIAQRLREPATRARMAQALEARLLDGAARGARAVFAAVPSGRHIGRTVTEAAADEGLPPGEFALRAIESEPYTLLVFHHGGTADEETDMVRRTIAHSRMMVASDGIYHGQRAHPRAYGCFARVLRLAVRELGAVRLEAAVHKMTGMPAERFRVPDRGLLRVGYAADVVVFDAGSVSDRSTYDAPYEPPVGVDHVVVGGEVAVSHGRPTGVLAGRVLRRRGA